MSKRHVFEDIFNSEFRWPMEGDTPFIEADDPIDNAVIAEDDTPAGTQAGDSS